MRNVSLSFNYTLLQTYATEFINRVGNTSSLTWSYDKVFASLQPSSCHFCTTTLCVIEASDQGDYFLVADVVLTLFYFLCLFLSGGFKRPSLMRRMLVPYIPILSMIMFILFKGVIARRCLSAVYYVSEFVTLWWVMIYIFTVIRFVYLRNLYQIMSKSENKKLHKFLASTTFGFIFTGLMSLVVSLLISADGAYNFVIDNESSSLLFRTAHLIVFALGSTLFGMVSILFDMFMNRKKIKSKGKNSIFVSFTLPGIMSFLLFDDPFFVRYVCWV